MKISLASPARRWAAAAIVMVSAAAYTAASARELIAAWLGNRVELTSLQRAAWLDPSNAEFHDHLGRYYDLVVRDQAAAVAYYREAVRLNPHSARYWLDLASAYQVLGDTNKQTYALEHAIQADAMTPDVAWEAANLYLVQGENQKALREFRIVMANDSSLAPSAIQFCWRIDPDIDGLLRDVVPRNVDAYIAFLGLLMEKQDAAGSYKVWNALMQTREPFELRYVYSYIHFLVQHKEVDDAVSVWRQSADRFGFSSYLPSPSNLIINPTFSLNILNGGFDWQYQKQQSLTLTLDPSDYHGGRRSLLITFDGPGISDAGIYQLVAVQPNTTYDFSAYYKNSEMEGAGGPHLVMQEMYTQQVYFQSDELKDAGFWKSVDGNFTTGPDCKLLVLRVVRLPAGSPIRGKLWIDDFHLVPKPA